MTRDEAFIILTKYLTNKNLVKEKSFAKGAVRKPILVCEENLGIPLKDFVEINPAPFSIKWSI